VEITQRRPAGDQGERHSTAMRTRTRPTG
jgi:hypothetical protein